jgi:hypothetical protein
MAVDGACRAWVPNGFIATSGWSGACRIGNADDLGTVSWQTREGPITVTGTFRDGALHGPGSRTTPDGGRYEGQFCMTVPQGQGVFVAPNGMRYEGPFAWGAPSGIGRATFRNGDRYEGGVQAGMGNGEGIYTWANGDRYEGTQRAGYPGGQGRCISGTQVFEGTWARGCFVDVGGTRIAVVRPMAECR